jgi:hypothetical protein
MLGAGQPEYFPVSRPCESWGTENCAVRERQISAPRRHPAAISSFFLVFFFLVSFYLRRSQRRPNYGSVPDTKGKTVVPTAAIPNASLMFLTERAGL